MIVNYYISIIYSLSVKECEVNSQFQFPDGQIFSLTILLPCVDVCHTERWNASFNANALRGNKIMKTNESCSFLARDLWRWYLEPELRRPAVFITENHTKHEKNVKQDVCFLTSYRNAVYFDPLLDGLGTARGNFKDSSLKPTLHFEIPAFNPWSEPQVSVENCFLSNGKGIFASFCFEWAQNIES